MEIKNKYEELRKKYSLPEYKEINQYFDIEEVDGDSEIILTKIRVKMYEKIEYYMKIFETLLLPDSNLNSMYESHYVNDRNKNEIYSLFKKLMLLIRKSNAVSVENDEKSNAEFIKEAFESYNNLKKDIRKHIVKLSEVWNRDTDMKNDINYFG